MTLGSARSIAETRHVTLRCARTQIHGYRARRERCTVASTKTQLVERSTSPCVEAAFSLSMITSP